MVTAGSAQRFFFVHVMKTAGFSLVRMIKTDVFDRSLVYPTPEDTNPLESSMEYAALRAISAERMQRIRVFSAHFPYAARAYLGEGLRTFALFRDPVERVISHLKHTVQRVPMFAGFQLDAVYAEQDMFRAFYDNLQLRFFAVSDLDAARSLFEPTLVQAEDVDRALENVRKLDVIGLTEDFADTARLLSASFDWPFKKIVHVNNTSPVEVPAGLRERIETDLALDRVFYEHVKDLYFERKRAFIDARGPLPDIALARPATAARR